MLKFAYCALPHTGGTYTVYRVLRDGLAPHNVEVKWVGLVPPGHQVSNDFKSELACGEAITVDLNDQKQASDRFVEHIQSNYNGVFINVLADCIQTNAARYIENHILKIVIVHNITPGTYRAASAVRDHVHATVGVSPRIAADLIQYKQFISSRVHTIPNSINLTSFQGSLCQPPANDSLKLLYLGRIEDNAKGVLWLPDILKECLQQKMNVSLSIAGDGADLPKLKRQIHAMKLEQNVQFFGRVDYSLIPEIVAGHHVLLMPSRYEGFGLTLGEAMSCGCVPICSLITGVTDFIVSHQQNGFLFKVGDLKQAVRYIQELSNQETWQRFSDKARTSIQSRFSSEQQACTYLNLIQALKENPPELPPILNRERWTMAAGLRPAFSTYLPNPVKNVLRVWREKIHADLARG